MRRLQATTMSTGQTLEARLSALTEKYVASLPARLEELETFVQYFSDAHEHEGRSLALQSIQACAHRLAGSGATYGFPDISDHAAQLDQHCVNNTSVTLMSLEDCVGRIGAAIRAATAIESNDDVSAVSSSGEMAVEARRKPRIAFLGTDTDTADSVSAQLEKFNYLVDVTTTIEQLVDVMARGNVVAIVLDGVFKGDVLVDGVQVSELINGQAIKPVLIVLSVRDDLVSRIAAVRAGCRHYLLKPLDPLAIVDVLDTAGVGEDEEPRRVMIVDDDEAMGQFISVILTDAEMIVEWVQEPRNLTARVEAFAPELILMDLYLPEFSGQELAAVLRQRERFSSIPIVYLSGEKDHGKQIAAMEQGADDFLTKPVNPNHLVRSVQSRINRFRRIRARMVRDGLTNLFNHTTMKQFLENETQRAKRYSGKLSYAIVDIDHFKSVNDTYGHGAGDVVLKTLSRLLRQRLRANDIIGRLGGEEFGVILPDTGMEQARMVLDQVRVAFQELTHTSDDKTFHVTFSCGIAEFPAYDHSVELSEAADKALYEAKNNGRNRIILSNFADVDQ